MFEQVSAEMSALTDAVVEELEAQLASHVNGILLGRGGSTKQNVSPAAAFLEKARTPAQANVRVVPSRTEYPTVESLVQDMEARRDISERLERARMLDVELKLLT